jgi:quercetin dioxygenase-like cupin family protein
MHFLDRIETMEPGEIIWVPRGEVHWAENIDDQPSEAAVVFSPAYDGTDKRAVEITE